MRNLKNLGRFLTVGACLLAFCVMTSETAFARAQYNKEYKSLYAGKKATCANCHVKADNAKKKKRNNYGVAVKKALLSKDVGGKVNDKDAAKIKKALEAAAKEKSHVDGKTFGELIADGQAPGKDEEVKEDD